MSHDKDYFEKEYDDHVYEDDYYAENYEEELEEEDDYDDENEDGDEEEGRRVHLIFACEDCDYRWDDYVTSYGSANESENFDDVACPMCGSVNIEQI